MMTIFRRDHPGAGAALRVALYGGAVFHFSPTAASRALVDDALGRLRRALGDAAGGDVRRAQAALPNDEFFRRVGEVRRSLYLDPAAHHVVRRLLGELGLDPARSAFDPVRLRVVAHDGHHNPAAAPVYYAHRDTWYAHPQALVVAWAPLHDVVADETFVFYPDWFDRPAPNDSEAFDYDAWVAKGWSLKIGWQDPRAGLTARYPQLTAPLEGARAEGFSARAGDVVLFSGAHLHETRRHALGRTRFSLDVRAVDLDDHARGLGAPNADNRSRGSSVPDYARG
jgi:hypothetical protein